MKVLIIEDEPFAAEELRRLLDLCVPGTDVLGVFDTVEDSVVWLRENPEPDLIFMDIQLADGLSFEIFKQVDVSSPIVFTTAFDNYAIQAFKLNSIDYLLKPIEEEALLGSLRKFESLKKTLVREKSYLNSSQVESLLTAHQREFKSRFVIKSGDRIRHVSVEDIAYFYSSDDYTYLVTLEKKKFIIDYTLDDLINVLNDKEFFRLSRKYIARIHSIKEVNKYFNSRLKVFLEPPTEDEILISRARVPGFMSWLEK